ncbi:MAG: hypothetical protein JWP75_3749 [Frondihabitans sp.]|nr:hypothetical protein [Frondihabitans sp.]
MSTRTRITLVAAAAFVAVGLAGCSSNGTPTATGTSTVSQAPSSPASTPATTPTTPPATTGTGSGSGSGQCATANLTGSYTNSSGTAGSTYLDIVLTNKGTGSCTIQGWPGVSIVGGGNGTQIGQAAAFDRTSAHGTVTLASGATAKAQLRIVQAGNYDASTCVPEKGDGVRVYPPGQKASLYIALPNVTGCKSTSVSLLTVQAFR